MSSKDVYYLCHRCVDCTYGTTINVPNGAAVFKRKENQIVAYDQAGRELDKWKAKKRHDVDEASCCCGGAGYTCVTEPEKHVAGEHTIILDHQPA